MIEVPSTAPRRALGPKKLWTQATLCALVLLACAAAWRVRGDLQHAARQPPRLELRHDVTGVWTGHSYAYVIFLPSGRIVLIDAGSDAAATALGRELQRRGHTLADVTDVLLTHGHLEQCMGLRAMPNAAVYVGLADGVLARGDRLPSAPWARLKSRLLKAQQKPRGPFAPHLHYAVAAQHWVWGDVDIEAVALPGHTDGSMAYRLGDVVFVGDSIASFAPRLTVYSRWVSQSPAHNCRSLFRLIRAPFEVLATAHNGVFKLDQDAFAAQLQTLAPSAEKALGPQT